jgi:hypothetical protein
MLYLAAGMPTVAQLRIMAQTASISCCRSGSLPSMMALPLVDVRCGFAACCPDRRSIEADDSVGNCTMSSDTPCDSHRSRSRVSDATLQLAGSSSLPWVAADVVDAVALEVLEAPRVGGARAGTRRPSSRQAREEMARRTARAAPAPAAPANPAKGHKVATLHDPALPSRGAESIPSGSGLRIAEIAPYRIGPLTVQARLLRSAECRVLADLSGRA